MEETKESMNLMIRTKEITQSEQHEETTLKNKKSLRDIFPVGIKQDLISMALESKLRKKKRVGLKKYLKKKWQKNSQISQKTNL